MTHWNEKKNVVCNTFGTLIAIAAVRASVVMAWCLKNEWMLVAKHIKSKCHKSSYTFLFVCSLRLKFRTKSICKMKNGIDSGFWRWLTIWLCTYYFIQMHFLTLNLNQPIRKDLDYTLESSLLLSLQQNIQKKKKKRICNCLNVIRYTLTPSHWTCSHSIRYGNLFSFDVPNL